jgi:hypothetical protein
MDKLLSTLQDQLGKSVDAIRAEAERMDAAANTATGGKIEPITPCVVEQRFSTGNISSFGSDRSRLFHANPSWQVCAKAAREALAAAREAIEKQHAINIPLLANNVEVSRQVRLIMTNLGIPEERKTYGYATPRARKMTTTTHVAGYVSDLAAACKTSDNYEGSKRVLDEFERRIERYESEEAAKERAVEAEKAREQVKRDRLVLLGGLAQKYGCEAEYSELIDAMCKRDKYFALAYWSERNRISWFEDGCDRMRTGLNYFTVETEEDEAVYAELEGLCSDWGGDGRVFRDCHYNFGTLYGMVNEQGLLEDLQKLRDAGLFPDD